MVLANPCGMDHAMDHAIDCGMDRGMEHAIHTCRSSTVIGVAFTCVPPSPLTLRLT